MKSCRLRTLALCALLLGACGDDDAGADGGATDRGTFDGGRRDAVVDDPRDDGGDALDGALDAAPPRMDASAPMRPPCDRFDDLERAGDEQRIVARFVAVEPELNVKGRYDWTFELRTTSGDEVVDAELEASAFMPAHGHGTAPITVRHQAGSARYELRDVNLFMAGKWELRLTVESSAGDDYIVFYPCVREPPDAGQPELDASDEDGG